MAIMCLIAVMPAASGTKRATLEKVGLRLDFRTSATHAGFFAARDQGFYEKEGLDVEIKPGAGSGSTVQQVAAGNDTFGWANAVVVVQQVAQGADVLMLASPRPAFDGGIVYWPQSGITKPKDLEGKTCAMTASGFVSLLFPVWASKVGVNASAVSVQTLDATVASSLFGAGKVDCLEATVPQLLFFPPRDGVAAKVFKYSDSGMNALSFGIIANSRQARGNPGLMAKFVRATLNGWRWACANPEPAVTNARKNISTSNTLQVDIEVWGIICKELSSTPSTKGRQLGWMALQDWQTTVDLVKSSPQLGLSPGRIPPPSTMFTNAYVPAATITATLNATVSAAGQVTLARGKTKPTALDAGTYRFVVTDKSALNGIRFQGPGVAISSPVKYRGSKTTTVFLKPGRYTFQSLAAPKTSAAIVVK